MSIVELLIRALVSFAICMGTTAIVIVGMLYFNDLSAMWGMFGYVVAAICFTLDREESKEESKLATKI